MSRASQDGVVAPRRSGWTACLAIFAAALTIRTGFLAELRAHSYLGSVRVSDAEAYHQLAGQLLAGTAPFTPFWQAPLYPYALAAFQWTFGTSLLAVQSFHIGVGALDCVLVYALGATLFGRRVGAVAGALAAFYAPFWLFDVQPLPTGVATLFLLLAVCAYLRARTGAGSLWLAASGASLGGAILSHGLALFTVPVFALDWIGGRARRAGGRGREAAALLLFLTTALAAPAAVSVRNSIAAGRPMFITHSVGINLFLGNQIDLDRALGVRNGYEWEALFREPRARGITSAAALDSHFRSEALAAWRESPAALARNAVHKAAMAISGAEIKRNFPIEPLREDSRLLRALLWRVEIGGHTVAAFPTGLVIPLAAVGLLAARRVSTRLERAAPSTALPVWLAVALAAGMLVFFPATWYRVAAVALLLPHAALAAVAAWDAVTQRRLPSWRVAFAFAGVFLLVNGLAPDLHRHPERELAEHHYYEARRAMQRLARAPDPEIESALRFHASEAARLDPAYPEPEELLAVYYLTRDLPRARAHFDRFAALVPADAEGVALLGSVLRSFETAR